MCITTQFGRAQDDNRVRSQTSKPTRKPAPHAIATNCDLYGDLFPGSTLPASSSPGSRSWPVNSGTLQVRTLLGDGGNWSRLQRYAGLAGARPRASLSKAAGDSDSGCMVAIPWCTPGKACLGRPWSSRLLSQTRMPAKLRHGPGLARDFRSLDACLGPLTMRSPSAVCGPLFGGRIRPLPWACNQLSSGAVGAPRSRRLDGRPGSTSRKVPVRPASG